MTASISNPKSTTQIAQDLMVSGLVLPPEGACFHCGEPLPKKPFFAHVLGQDRAMCCLGCQLAATSIVEAGLQQYYLDRQSISRLASVPDELQLDVYNHDEIKSQFTYTEDQHTVAELSVAGLRCAACTWLIESRLGNMNGVLRCQVNLTQQRMRVSWDENTVQIGDILKAVAKIGYEAYPYRQDTHEAMLRRQNKTMLVRLGVAAIGAMQAMMFSIGMYFGEYSGIAPEHREFLRYVSMIVSIPVVFYAGIPFFASAWSAIRAKSVNMDVPVSIALLITFFASSFALLSQTGETYFDSVAMFVFFLLAGRYVEQNARLKAASMASDLVVVAPKLVKKRGHDGDLLRAYQKGPTHFAAHIQNYTPTLQNDTLIHTVKAGDIVEVGAGDEILGDGILLSAKASVSQSLLTGEGDLIVKNQGDFLLGGSQNDAHPLLMLVTADGKNSQIALIDRLINRAMSEKPPIAEQVDRIARVFVARILVLAVVVFVAWWFVDPSYAIWATVAVLVATCPCALSLATPTALTVATNRLAQKNFLATRGHTITALSKIDVVAFDKTGTLTTGKANLTDVVIVNHAIVQDLAMPSAQETLLAYAGALESGLRHPIAESLRRHSQALHLPTVSHLNHHVGGGVSGVIDGREYRLGAFLFALGVEHEQLTQHPDAHLDADYTAHNANMAAALTVCVDGVYRLLAWFYFNDIVRPDTHRVIDTLKDTGVRVLMLTGDPSDNAQKLAQQLDIDYHKGLLPEDKVRIIQALQKDQQTVLMVGDGINDAPVLAAADVSVAMANAADLAQVAADGVILGDTLSPIVWAHTIAQKTHAIIRQNLRWAFIYNALMIVPAALGYVPPYLAAIGMSLSSLFVVLNALRIKKS